MIRSATIADFADVRCLVHALAAYARLSYEVVFNDEPLREHLFGPKHCAEVLLAEEQGDAVSFSLFLTFSTFLGQPRLYLEDLFGQPKYCSRSHGKTLLLALVKLVVDRGCDRLKWAVLDWNQSAIHFYRSLVAKPLDDATVYRLTGDALKAAGSG